MTEFCRKMPKVELHAHLNGSLTINSIEKLIRMSNDPTIQVPRLLSTPSSMEDVFKLFPVIQAVTAKYELVKQATIDVIADFGQENTAYLELRSTPKERAGFSKRQYVEAILEGIRESEARSDMVVRLLLSIDRRQSLEEAEETVKMVAEDKTGLIVGVDLSGDPSVDGRKFIPLLKKAKAAGIKLAIHLAEIKTCLDEVDAFLDLPPDRIGHGTFLHLEDRWVETIVRGRIPFEVCLTSNVMSMTTETVADSHFTFWKEKGLPVAICTDDSGLMGTDLSNEYLLAKETFDPDLRQIVSDSLEMSFLDKKSPAYCRVKELIESQFMSK